MNQISRPDLTLSPIEMPVQDRASDVSTVRIVIAILLIGLVASVALTVTVFNREYREVRKEIAQENQFRASRIESELQREVLIVRALAAHSAVARWETRESLSEYSRQIGARSQGLEALGWAPLTVSGKSLLSDLDDGGLSFPIAEFWSWGNDLDLLGLDVLPEDVIATGEAVEIFRALEADAGSSEKRFLFAVPVAYREDTAMGEPLTVQGLIGYVVGVLNVSTTIGNVVAQSPVSDADFTVYENRFDSAATVHLFELDNWRTSLRLPDLRLDWLFPDARSVSKVSFIDRTWNVETQPTSWRLAADLVGPPFFCALIGLLLSFSLVWYVVRARNERAHLERVNETLLVRDVELKEKTALVRGIFDDVPDAMVLADENRRIVMLNPSAEREFGYTTAEVQGSETKLLYANSTDFSEQGKKRYNPDASSTVTSSFQIEYSRRDGSEFTGETVGAPIHDDSGQVIAYLGVIRNVTERNRLQRELIENREFLRVLLDSIDNGIVACDGDGNLKLFNRATTEFHGLPLQELAPEEWSQYYNLYHEDGRTPMAVEEIPLFRALKGELVKNAEMVIRTNAGQTRRLRASGQALTDPDGTCIGAVVSMSDVSREREAEEALRQSQRLEAIGKLTGGIAHDFNNLLGIVLGNLQFLERLVGGDEKAAKRVTGAISAAQRGAQLTRRLLNFSRQEVHTGESTDINETISGFRDMLARSLTSEIEVEFHPGDGLWLTEIDPGDLCDALLNLAINARDAMPGGGRLFVETGNQTFSMSDTHFNVAPGDYVQLTVSDTGSGIPPEVLERVFEPFYTTKEAGKGTGLGLSMVYAFVKRSRGDIRIYSEQGHGTTVRLLLPRTKDVLAANGSAASAPVASCGGSEKILIVDDEPELLELASSMLSGLGYTIFEANDGPSALRMLQRHADVDLVLTDVIMPGGMDGFQVAEAARRMSPDIRIVLASGFTGRTAAKGADTDFTKNMIAKPYGLEELSQAVRRSLDELNNSLSACGRTDRTAHM